MFRFLILAACAVMLAGCCSADPAPATPGAAGLDLEPVIAQPVRGVCLPIPFVGCKICLGVSCDVPPLIEPAVFGTPVARPSAPAAPAAPAPCAPVYVPPCDEPAAPAPAADPCGSWSDGYCPECEVPWPASGSASDGTNTINGIDYGVPPALQVR